MATDHKTLGDQPAIPHHQVEESETFTRTFAQHKGVSKREFFIGCALMGAAANDDFDATIIAQQAVMAADAVLELMAGGAA